MSEALLFIGGSIDGERMAVLPLPMLRIPEREEFGCGWIGLGTDPCSERKYEDYRLVRLGGNTAVFSVYALDGMTADDVLSRLIAGYSSPSPNSAKRRPLSNGEVIQYGDRYEDDTLAGITPGRNGIGDQFRNGIDSDIFRIIE
jgi:hypothetical protein